MVRRLLTLLLLVMALAGCQRVSQQADQAPEVTMTLVADPAPPAVGPSSLTITLTDGQGRPIEGASLRIKGDMAHAGMVPVRAEAEGGSGGVYETDFQWTMGGDWVVTVLVTLPDGRITSRSFDLAVAGEMTMPMEATETP